VGIKHAHKIKNYTGLGRKERVRDSKKSLNEWDELKHQAWDQSYKEPMKSSMIFPT
jgi:hypothetical protein